MWIYTRYNDEWLMYSYISRILEQISMRIAEKSPPYLKLLTTECCGAGSADDLSFNWPQDSAYLCHGKNHHFHIKTALYHFLVIWCHVSSIAVLHPHTRSVLFLKAEMFSRNHCMNQSQTIGVYVIGLVYFALKQQQLSGSCHNNIAWVMVPKYK